MYESERAFTLADHIRQNALFYTAGLTRERNQEKSNEDRLKLIGADTDFVLSIHIGSDMDRAKNYAIAYVPFDSRESASAACYILNEIATKLPEITAVAIIPTDKLDLLGKNTGKVALMLEIGNMQQPRDSSMLYTKTFKIGDAIVDGIEAYYEGSP
jgi:N-acetylmuramoyl-L-alanine amidase